MRIFIVLLIVFFIIIPTKANAYLDPGTGSYLIQIFVGGGLSIIFILKQYWSQIVTFIKKLKSDKKNGKKVIDEKTNS